MRKSSAQEKGTKAGHLLSNIPPKCIKQKINSRGVSRFATGLGRFLIGFPLSVDDQMDRRIDNSMKELESPSNKYYLVFIK